MNQPPAGWSPQPPQSQQPPPQLPQAQPLPAQPQPPPMGAVSRGRAWVLPAAAGFGASVLVGGVLLATNVVSFGSGGGSVSTSPISLPLQLADLQDAGEVFAETSSNQEQADARIEGYERQRSGTIEAYQRAYDGAAADSRSYWSLDLYGSITVIAVRAPSPGLTNGPVTDLESLNVEAHPQHPDLIVDGGVECFVMVTAPVPIGEEVDPDDLRTFTCQRSDDSLTVYTYGTGTLGPEGRALMIEATNEAFDAVS